MRRIVAICLFTFVAGICRAQGTGTEEQRTAGKAVYDRMCSQCHGEQGDGNGVAKYFFLPRPRDFTYGLFKIRTTESGMLPTHDDLKNIIRHGMPYTGMPPWPKLSEEDLNNVVYYIKTFAAGFEDEEPAAIRIPKAPRFSDESAARGREVYEENKCYDCHGDAGRGNGKSAPTLKNDWDEPIRPADLTKRWTFRGGSSREDIYRTFTTGLNGTPMPSYADLITEEDRWHLVDYVYSLSRDEANYAAVVTASAVEGEIDVTLGPSLFESASPALFPVLGQVIEPGRDFYPNANAVEVRAVYSATDVAIMVTWHDMTENSSASNDPTMPVPRFDPTETEEAGEYSDAVAVQIPSQGTAGSVKPYFLFGDKREAVDIWFADLAQADAELMVGHGSQSIERAGPMPVWSSWEDGQWNVIFQRSRHPDGRLSLDEGTFVPIAFSVWDGFNQERGSKRGLTDWYYVYLQPSETESKAIPMVGYAMLTLVIEVILIGAVRMRASAASKANRA